MASKPRGNAKASHLMPLELWRFSDTEPTAIPYTPRHSRIKEWRVRFDAWRLRRDRRYNPRMDGATAFMFSFWGITGLSPSQRPQAEANGAFRFVDFCMGRKIAKDISLWASMYARLAP